MRSILLILSLFSLNLWGQNHKIIDSLKQQVHLAKSDEDRAFYYSELSWEYASSQLDSSLYYADKTILLAKKTTDLNLLADAYNSKGLANDYSGNLQESLIWYNKSLGIRTKQHNTRKIANVYNNIGASYYYNAKYKEALENYLKALSYRELEQDSLGMAQSFNNIGLVHRTQNNFEKAKMYYLKSLVIKEQLNDAKGMIYPLTNLSVLTQNLKNYSDAESYIKKALHIAEVNHFENEIGIQKSNLGVNYLLKKEFLLATQYLNEAKTVFTNNNNEKTLGIIHLKLGEAYFELKNFARAKDELLQALFLSKKYNKLELQQNILLFLSKLASDRNDYKSAYKYLSQSNEVKDSIFSIQKFKALSELEAKYQAEKKEQQINTLHLKIEKDRAQRKLWLIGSTLVGLLLILLVIFLYTNKKKSQKLAIALADRETLLKEIHHRVKNNLQIVSSLLNLQTRYMKDDTAINAVKDSKNRVNSMALIHQKLYQNDSLTGVAMNDYITDLSESLLDSFGLKQEQLTLEVSDILLDVDTVIPIGLILNELIINTIKHTNQSNLKIIIRFIEKETELLLQVKDNGKGLPNTFDYKKSESYGMKLIYSLAKKLRANVIFENENGLIVSIIIKDYKIIE